MKSKKITQLLLFVCVLSELTLLSSNIVWAQKEASNWCFGYGAGIEFEDNGNITPFNSSISTFEGVATISDKNGNLLFYSDGISVWNRNHNVMPNGNNLTGDPSSTQSGVIVPLPGSSNLYYLFSVPAFGNPPGLAYSIIDMNLDSGLGDIGTIKNVILYPHVNERLTAVLHKNKRDIWIIGHAYGNDTFLVYLITPSGIQTTPYLQKIGISHADSGVILRFLGYLKASPDGSTLAIAFNNDIHVEIFNFDNSIGKITTRNLLNIFTNPYGIEFSPDSKKLYIAETEYSNPRICQLDLTQNSTANLISSLAVISSTTNYPGYAAIQNAPNGKMYVTEPGTNFLSEIEFPNVLGVQCKFSPQKITLSGTASYGLPNFITSFFNVVRINTQNQCLGDSTSFSITASATIDSVKWHFGDSLDPTSNESTLKNPKHLYSNSGSYWVKVSYRDTTGLRSDSILITIEAPPIKVLPSNVSFCESNPLELDAGNQGSTFVWSTGETTQKITISQDGTYWVRIIKSDCIRTDTITVKKFSTISSSDTFLCLRTQLILDAGTQGDIYLWSNGSTQQTIKVSLPGNYSVDVSNGPCSKKINYTVVSYPSRNLPLRADLDGNNLLLLNAGNQGAIYQWSTGDTSRIISVRDSGMYWVRIQNGICSTTDTIHVRNNFMPFIDIPSAFSPNQDAKNENLIFNTKNVANLEMFIYSRWGEMVFYTNDSSTFWDGRFKNEPCQEGVYVYLVKYIGTKTGTREFIKRGTITLVH
jgi:gliding motility-associated-like protein